MPKNFFQDMARIKNESKFSVKTKFVSVNDVTEKPNNVKKSKRGLWFIAGISIIFFIFSISHLFFKVVVTVNPKIKNVVLNESLLADKSGEGGALSFDLIIISGEEDKMIQATEEKNVSEKAQGVVLIYNNFSSGTQRFAIDTRFEGSNGKIYKTVKAVVVPGMKGNTPGSLEVNIYAAEAGEEYNSGPLDFTIFGFKGTPKYSKFYARSKGEITGGFKGKVPAISDAEKLATTNDLKAVLQAKLFKKATDQIPNGFVLFKNGAFLNIDESNTDLASLKDNMFPVKVKGTLYGFLFDEEKLSKKIVADNIKEFDGSSVYLTNIRDLTFSLINKDNISFEDVKNISFSLKGSTKIVWKLDENKLKNDLLGKSKKDFTQILLQYPNVDSADLVISPFWKMSLPDKTKDIKVIVNYPK